MSLPVLFMILLRAQQGIGNTILWPIWGIFWIQIYCEDTYWGNKSNHFCLANTSIYPLIIVKEHTCIAIMQNPMKIKWIKVRNIKDGGVLFHPGDKFIVKIHCKIHLSLSHLSIILELKGRIPVMGTHINIHWFGLKTKD